MRFVTGDEVGLVKVTTAVKRLQESAPPRPSKKRRGDAKPAEGATPAVQSTTQVFGAVNRNAAVQLMCWASAAPGKPHSQVVVARANGTVQYMSVEDGSVVREHQIIVPRLNEVGLPLLNKYKKTEHFVGLADVNGTLIACTDLGILHVIPPPPLTDSAESQLQESRIPGGVFTFNQDLLFRARTHPQHPHLLATGGDERELAIWDLLEQPPVQPPADGSATTLRPLTATWTARNVKNDFLNIRVPVWITDIRFLDSTKHRLIVGTGHHQIRVYDTLVARRPIIDIKIGSHPVRALSVPTPLEDQSTDNISSGVTTTAIVSDTTGQLFDLVLDVAAKTAKVAGKYAGLSGAITDIALPQNTSTVVTAGLDRFVKVFELGGDRTLLNKTYLKGRLTSVLVDDPETAAVEGVRGGVEVEEAGASAHSDDSGEEEDDQVWDEIEDLMEEVEQEKEEEERQAIASQPAAKKGKAAMKNGAPSNGVSKKRKKKSE
ncbi:WD repeat-containing protein 74 [Geranomyces michiganensis]|nr:WD repeat-containing protein 74 [Geranomyces michiganensis]